MKALLLAAGMGSRLRPITDHIPKCMVPIMGRPLLEYWIERIKSAPIISEIIINTHYLPHAVNDFVANNPFRHQITLVHENRLLGTGGTLKAMIPRLTGHDVLVAHADNLTLFDMEQFYRVHTRRPSGCLATMMTFETDDPRSCGIVELDSRDVVQEFHEKVENPPGTLANAAVFILSAELLPQVCGMIEGETGEISTDLLPKLRGKMFTHRNRAYHRDIGRPESLATAERDFPEAYRTFIANGGRP